MQEIVNAVVIDDNPSELLKIVSSFSGESISTLPIHYEEATGAFEKCKKVSSLSPKIIITDIQLNDPTATPTKNDLTCVAQCILNIVENTSGPYIILAWSSVASSFGALQTRVHEVLKKKKVRDPIYFEAIDKTDCKLDDGAFCTQKILEKFSQHLDSQKEIRALMQWEKSVLSAATDTVNELIDCDEANLANTLTSLGEIVAGKNLQGNESEAINESLVCVLKDRLSYIANDPHSKNLWADAIPSGVRSTLSDKRGAELNNIIHFDSNVSSKTICPGDIWEILDTKHFLQLFTMPSKCDDFLATFKKSVIKETSIQNEKLICVEISPACDFAQNKRLAKQVALGMLIPIQDSNKKALGKKLKDCRETIISISLQSGDETYYLCVSKSYIASLAPEKIQNFEINKRISKILRVRESLLLSWIQSISSHNSRIGTASF